MSPRHTQPLRTLPFLTSLFFLPLLFTPLHTTSLPPSPSPTEIISINGTTSFKSLISKNTLTFIKFFHPRCPHCRSFAPHFLTLSSLISTHNSHPNTTTPNQITLAEVDASNDHNKHLIITHAEAFPTLKLYSSGRLVSEYTGPRRPQPMFDFLQETLLIRSSALVEPLHSRQDLSIFLNHSATRPVILTIFHPNYTPSSIYPPHIRPSANTWHSTTRLMRNTTLPNAVFASVPNPTFLLPPDPKNKARFENLIPIPYHPVMVAASDASRFWDLAEWWFPAMRHADSMQTFMHLSTMPRERYLVLDPILAPIILQTSRPIVIAFGKEDEPSWNQREFLVTAASRKTEPRMVAVYANVDKYEEFAEHIGVMREGEEKRNGSGGDYVVYRSGVMKPFVDVFVQGGTKNVIQWVKGHAQAFNKSRVLTPPGQVVELDPESWDTLFQHDGRGVLLELYRSDCGACKRFQSVYQDVAKMLAPHAGALVVARYDISEKALPAEPKLPGIEYVPAVVYVPAGGDGVLFEGIRWRWSVARFARQQSETEEMPFASVGMGSVVAWYLSWAGLGMLCVGIGLHVMDRLTGRFSKQKRDHVM